MLDLLALLLGAGLLLGGLLVIGVLAKLVFTLILLPLKLGFALARAVVGLVLLLLCLVLFVPLLATIVPLTLALLVVPLVLVGSLGWLVTA